MVPAEQLGVVVLANLSAWGARQIAEYLASSVLGAPVLRPTFEDPLRFKTRYTLPGTDTLSQYVGTYTRGYQAQERRITVEMGAGELMVQYPNREPIPFIAVTPSMFMSQRSGNWRPIHFVRDAEGNVNNLLYRGLPYQRRR